MWAILTTLQAHQGLSEAECAAVIDFAELKRFQHQSSRGPAHGEASACVQLVTHDWLPSGQNLAWH